MSKPLPSEQFRNCTHEELLSLIDGLTNEIVDQRLIMAAMQEEIDQLYQAGTPVTSPFDPDDVPF